MEGNAKKIFNWTEAVKQCLIIFLTSDDLLVDCTFLIKMLSIKLHWMIYFYHHNHNFHSKKFSFSSFFGTSEINGKLIKLSSSSFSLSSSQMTTKNIRFREPWRRKVEKCYAAWATEIQFMVDFSRLKLLARYTMIRNNFLTLVIFKIE